jgi:hypothetical protein
MPCVEERESSSASDSCYMPLLTVVSPILILRDHVKETMIFVGDATSGLEKMNAQLEASKPPTQTALNSH